MRETKNRTFKFGGLKEMEKAKTNDIKFIYAAQAVRKVVRAMPEGFIFSGYDLKKLCVKEVPQLKNMYVETFLREMRAHCKDAYICENRRQSLYSKIGKAE
jgi:hypothetical protein